MKEYLKMSDVFCKTDSVETNVIVAFAITVDYDDGVTPHEHAHHAIQHHDELVAEVERLHGILDRIIKSSHTLSKKMPLTEFGDGYKQCAMDAAGAIESLINKGA
jgi:hypothetical protein